MTLNTFGENIIDEVREDAARCAVVKDIIKDEENRSSYTIPPITSNLVPRIVYTNTSTVNKTGKIVVFKDFTLGEYWWCLLSIKGEPFEKERMGPYLFITSLMEDVYLQLDINAKDLEIFNFRGD